MSALLSSSPRLSDKALLWKACRRVAPDVSSLRCCMMRCSARSVLAGAMLWDVNFPLSLTLLSESFTSENQQVGAPCSMCTLAQDCHNLLMYTFSEHLSSALQTHG